MEKAWKILLSGTIGALLATLLSMWYQHVSEQIRARKDAMRAVIEWVDNIYVRLQAMQIHKERIYTGQEPSLSAEEYRSMSDEMRVLLLSDRIVTEVVCVYGEGDVLQKINALQGELTKAARILWAAKQDTWADSTKGIMKIFKEKIDPIKASVMKDFFHSTGKISILRREQMTSRIKKIIAREGLIIIGLLFCGVIFYFLNSGYLNLKNKYFEDIVMNKIEYKQLPEPDKIEARQQYDDINFKKPVSGMFRDYGFQARLLYYSQLMTFWLLILGYPTYFLLRFVFWALRTLKHKEENRI